MSIRQTRMHGGYAKFDEGGLAHNRMVRNVQQVHDMAPIATRVAGRQWYERVNEAVGKGIRRTPWTMEQGAGVVAAVSPNMDWERNNINAFDEFKAMNENDWRIIEESSRSTNGRTAVAQDLLSGTSLSGAQDRSLMKARRILLGEPIEGVLRRQTGPKTNSFWQNIAYPDAPGPVTIDGRAHDIAINELHPWPTKRGISTAALPSGRKTRYEQFEDVYREAADEVGILPHEMQAVTWTHGKALEHQGVTKKGQPRIQGVRRNRQGYF
jgi:hypothetical protein